MIGFRFCLLNHSLTGELCLFPDSFCLQTRFSDNILRLQNLLCLLFTDAFDILDILVRRGLCRLKHTVEHQGCFCDGSDLAKSQLSLFQFTAKCLIFFP